MKFSGMARVAGDDLDTDQMYPTKYVNLTDTAQMALHCMENYDETFIRRIHKGDIIVAGKNFGCGSSREHAPLSIKGAGISCVVAKSFSRIFYRNAINIGLPIVTCEKLYEDIEEGDLLTIDMDEGMIENHRSQKHYEVTPFPEFLQEIIKNGGLMGNISHRRKL